MGNKYDNHGDIFRTYLGTKINVTKGTNDVYENLLKYIKINVAKKNKMDMTQRTQAQILTQFFRTIKNIKTSFQKAEIAEIIQNLGSPQLQNILMQIDFNVGGADFERELNKLIDPENYWGTNFIKEVDKTIGDVTAGVKWNISQYGKNDINIKDFLEKIKTELRKNVEEDVEDKLRILRKESCLTWSVRKQGKTDVMGAEDLIAFYNLEGSPDSIIKQGIEILSGAKISVKSYNIEDSQIHLGDTDAIKAYISIVSMFGKTKSSMLSPSFFIAHQEGYVANSEKKTGKETQERVDFTYDRYNKAIDAYELAGYGLHYSILNEILTEGADFLLINRTGNSNIVVLSVLDILNEFFMQFEKGNSKTVSINTIISRLEKNS